MKATYFDGQTARHQPVDIIVSQEGIWFSGDGIAGRLWSLSGLHPIDPPSPGQPFRLTHDKHPGERLILADEAPVQQLLGFAPHLAKGYLPGSHFLQVAKWMLGGIAVLAAAGYIIFTVLPSWAAQVLPESWKQRAGEQVEKSVIGDAKTCTAPAGVAAFNKLLTRLGKDHPDLATARVTVYDMDLLNAFAAPGGRVIFTRKILAEASTPDEIAAVLAHELGHVANHHPEEQLVRVAGLQILLSAFSGSGSDTLGNLAGLAAIFRYSREAETEADAFAVESLHKNAIDPMAFKSFFEKLLKLEGRNTEAAKTTALDRVGNIFSTHPDTRLRIDAIKPLPADVKPEPSLSAEEWAALQAICATTRQ